MEQEQLREFARLQDEALARLRVGVNRKGYLCQFRAITIPSVEDSLAYEILLPAGSFNVSRSDAMPGVYSLRMPKAANTVSKEKQHDAMPSGGEK